MILNVGLTVATVFPPLSPSLVVTPLVALALSIVAFRRVVLSNDENGCGTTNAVEPKGFSIIVPVSLTVLAGVTIWLGFVDFQSSNVNAMLQTRNALIVAVFRDISIALLAVLFFERILMSSWREHIGNDYVEKVLGRLRRTVTTFFAIKALLIGLCFGGCWIGSHKTESKVLSDVKNKLKHRQARLFNTFYIVCIYGVDG